MTTLLQRCTEAVAKLSPDREPHNHVNQVRAVLAVVAEECEREAEDVGGFVRGCWRHLAADLRRED